MLLVCLFLSLFGAPQQDKPELDGIAHVALRVSDIDQSRNFFLKLGFEEAFSFPDEKGLPTVSYVKINDRQWIELYRRNTPEEPLGLMHLCFDAPDIEALAKVYESRGVKPENLRKAKAGNMLFSVHDPENRLIEYTQYLPGSLHWKEHGQHLTKPRVSDHLLGAAAPAKDLASVRAFYTSKLHCRAEQGDGPLFMVLPGKFQEQVELDEDSPDWKPRLIFGVSDIQSTRAELGKRGMAPPAIVHSTIDLLGLDGIRIVFVLQ